MPEHRVVLDTNVLISGILFGGKPREVLRLALQSRVSAFLSPAIVREFREVLERPKFGLRAEECFAITEELEAAFAMVFPEIMVMEIEDDPDDNAVLECALQADAEYVITGDSHLLGLDRFRSIQILTPAEYLQRFWRKPSQL